MHRMIGRHRRGFAGAREAAEEERSVEFEAHESPFDGQAPFCRRGRGGHGGLGGFLHDLHHGHRGSHLDHLFASAFGRPPKARRGDIRAAILALLAQGSYNGYQLIQELEQRSGGMWRPSPGSIYPTLQQLEDEGLVRAQDDPGGNGRSYSLTDQGQAHVKKHKLDKAAPWDALTRAGAGRSAHRQMHELREQIGQLAVAAIQVVRAGNAKHANEALRLIGDTRRALYRILSEDDGDAAEDGKDSDVAANEE